MDCYIDLLLRGDGEVPIYFVRNKIFAKFHRVLSRLNQNSIGVSFPEYKVKLGNVMRIHGDRAHLEKLQGSDWLGGLVGYCDVSNILSVPKKIKGYRTVSRVRTNMTNAKLQRLIKRDSIVAEDVKKYKEKMYNQDLDNPYLELVSTSNGNRHRRFIAFGELSEKSTAGDFDTFGMSKVATIPWF